MEPSTNQKRPSNEVEGGDLNQKKAKIDDINNDMECKDEKKNEENPIQKDIKNQKDEEQQFLRLFTMVLNIIISIKDVKDSEIEKGIQDISDSFKEKPFAFDKINLRKWENVCAYLYRYGSHGAGFARHRILSAIKNCEDLKRTLKKPDIKIIALGSGPGNDAVGLCSALADLKYPKNLEITMVDKIAEWRPCVQFAKFLIDNGNFGKVSDLFQKTNVVLRYCQVDLPGNSVDNRNYFNSLAVADVILIFRLVSILPLNVVFALMESLYENMRDEALILLNHKIDKIQWTNFDCLYSWEIKDYGPYQSLALAEPRFYREDNIQSIQPINVLRKKKGT